jgi:target of rapamycin complex 2 subunit MAPKAP1
VQQNRVLEAKIQRRPSRIMATRKKSDATPSMSTLAPPSTIGLPGMMGLSVSIISPMPHMLSSSAGQSSSYGPQQFIRIRTADAVDSVHLSTVVPV